MIHLIEQRFNHHKNNPSDINEHLQTLFEYAKRCDVVTEMGVRWVSSTWAFLLAQPKKLISYDIVRHDALNEVEEFAKGAKINFTFHEQDVLKVNIEKTDMLFIDTLHTYAQLIQELNKHSKQVKKWIIMHDTTTFGEVDENIYEHASSLAMNFMQTKQGLMNAIVDFLDTEEGKNWTLAERYVNNNGLTVLKRVK